MDLVLYKTKSDSRTAQKSLEFLKNVEFVLKKDSQSLLRPIIEISYDSTIKDCNYCYISSLNRYYFIEKTMKHGNILELQLLVDTAMSFYSELIELECTVARNENERNGYLIDGEYKAYSYEQKVTKRFPNAMNNDTVILMTVG